MSVTVMKTGGLSQVFPDADLVRPNGDNFWICRLVKDQGSVAPGYTSYDVFAHVVPEPGMVIYYDDNKPMNRTIKSG